MPDTPAKETKNYARAAIGVATDFLLMFSGLVFDFPFLLVFPPTAALLIPLIIALLIVRRYPRLKRNILIRVAFFIFVIFTLDVIVLMHFAIYGWHTLLLLPAPLSYLIALRYRNHPLLQWDRVQSLVAPLLVTFVISTAGDSPQSRSACGKINNQRGVKLLYEFPTKTRVRYVLKLKGRPELLVSFRKGFTLPQPNYVPRTLETITPATGRVKSWIDQGEVIGLHQQPIGDVMAVVIQPVPDKAKGASYLDMLIFSPDGKLKSRLPMPNARSDYYTANIFPEGKDYLIFVESNIFRYYPARKIVKLVDFKKDFTPYYMVRYGDSFIGVTCKSPLIMATAPAAIMKYSMRSLALTGKKTGGPFGYYEVREAGGRGKFVASVIWGGGGLLFDENLRAIKDLKIPKGTRNFGVDSTGRYIIAPNIFTGVMRVLDIEKNRLLPGSWFVGKGARSLNDGENGKIIIGNSCGLVEVDPSKIINSKE